MDTFRQRLKQRDLLIGTLFTLPSPEIAEILSEAGFDWLWVDMEHTLLDVQNVQRILQAVEGKCPCIVRVPSNDEVWIKKVLDIGPAGIIVPHVNSAEEVQKILQFSKYPPEGTRSAGISRAQGYGMKFQDYVDHANKDIIVIPQIEHIDAVDNIESIVGVAGISAIFVGPYDLSGSMGKLGNISDAEVQQKIKIVKNACLNAGLPVGIFGVDADAVEPYINIGYTLIAVGVDTLFLGKSAQQAVQSLRG